MSYRRVRCRGRKESAICSLISHFIGGSSCKGLSGKIANFGPQNMHAKMCLGAVTRAGHPEAAESMPFSTSTTIRRAFLVTRSIFQGFSDIERKRSSECGNTIAQEYPRDLPVTLSLLSSPSSNATPLPDLLKCSYSKYLRSCPTPSSLSLLWRLVRTTDSINSLKWRIIGRVSSCQMLCLSFIYKPSLSNIHYRFSMAFTRR